MKKKFDFLIFWKKIRFKYKLSFLNENTLEEVFAFRLSRLSAILTLIAFAFFLIAITSVVILNTPIRNYLPGYMDTEIRREMIENALKTDSLEQVSRVQSQYLDNVMDILKDNNPVADTTKRDTVTYNKDNLKKSDFLTNFVHNYEEEERYNLNLLSPATTLPENLIFYRPAKGIISANFNPQEKHYGVDIATTPNESVLATMKGTVISAGFEANGGYILQIQHPNGFISIYKHNERLLKKQGDEVRAGEAVAIAGNTGSLSNGIHLHFELWYNGKPMNPEEFIVF
ncbi:peptidase M23 [Bacteroidia bacterium]|nr:peptidase M23 [Bacteroidia bacterium]